MEAITIIYIRSIGVLTHYHSRPIDYSKLIIVDWFSDTDGLAVGSCGDGSQPLNETASTIAISSIGEFSKGSILIAKSTELIIESFGDVWRAHNADNWVRWSNIGSLDFTIGLDNVAGERPMDWPGQVYKIKKLGSNIVVYGANGISLLTPHGVSYGLTNISKIGLKGRNAIVGDSITHFFISSLGDLYKFDTELQKLGYQEYLAPMNSPILSYDERTKIIYICDGNLGYVYATENGSFGIGPSNITGIGYQDERSYVATTSLVNIPIFEIWTDIIDFGTRGAKTIHSIEFGIDATEDLQAAIEFRVNKSQSFFRTPWTIVNPAGISYIFCHGIEFRVGVQANSYTYLELDSLSIEGRIT